mmetsp:Transcript_7469/g.22678  ORF Transcript_7469/g.22678 Transcript_7469/m.22678 type:complete len:202 (+) Transcript_7469:482-1087(+)
MFTRFVTVPRAVSQRRSEQSKEAEKSSPCLSGPKATADAMLACFRRKRRHCRCSSPLDASWTAPWRSSTATSPASSHAASTLPLGPTDRLFTSSSTDAVIGLLQRKLRRTILSLRRSYSDTAAPDATKARWGSDGEHTAAETSAPATIHRTHLSDLGQSHSLTVPSQLPLRNPSPRPDTQFTSSPCPARALMTRIRSSGRG